MFHPHIFRLFLGIPHSTAAGMTLTAAFKVEEDLQRQRAERKEQVQSEGERKTEERRGDPLRIQRMD